MKCDYCDKKREYEVELMTPEFNRAFKRRLCWEHVGEASGYAAHYMSDATANLREYVTIRFIGKRS